MRLYHNSFKFLNLEYLPVDQVKIHAATALRAIASLLVVLERIVLVKE